MKTLKKRQKKHPGLEVIVMAVVALVVALVPVQAPAAVNCGAASPLGDADRDGLSDLDECAGITLTGVTFPNCALSGSPRANCVDPDSRDAFFILTKASPTNITFSNPLEFLQVPLANGGTGWTAHEITFAQAPNGNVTSTQKAILIQELLDTGDGLLGIADWGGPNVEGRIAKVYTQRIKNCVNTVFASGTCNVTVSPAGVDHPEVYVPYMKQVTTHEASHVLALEKVYNSRYGGYHSKTGTGYIMDQTTTYSTKGGVKFNIPTVYTTIDPTDACYTKIIQYTTDCTPLQ